MVHGLTEVGLYWHAVWYSLVCVCSYEVSFVVIPSYVSVVCSNLSIDLFVFNWVRVSILAQKDVVHVHVNPVEPMPSHLHHKFLVGLINSLTPVLLFAQQFFNMPPFTYILWFDSTIFCCLWLCGACWFLHQLFILLIS